jgi:NTP pyrophosphatase (non-canonical NTP hydrolase)
MMIAEFQQWTRDMDRDTQWELMTTLQALSHLAEEVGELAQSINRIYEYTGEVQEKHLANLRGELVDVLWFLIKIANKFEVDLDAEIESFVKRADQWPVEKHRSKLVEGLRALDKELLMARTGLNLLDGTAKDSSL